MFRSIQGVWACCNPDCSEVPETNRAEGRRIGRLFHQPRYRCDCGARVLELLYCQNCGEAFLGGFLASHPQGEAFAAYLLPEMPDLELLPERAADKRTAIHLSGVLAGATGKARRSGLDGWEREVRASSSDRHS